MRELLGIKKYFVVNHLDSIGGEVLFVGPQADYLPFRIIKNEKANPLKNGGAKLQA